MTKKNQRPTNGENITDDCDEYYMQDTRSIVGNFMLFWEKENCGYVCEIREARVFTQAEAIEQCESRSTDKAWPKWFIDSIIKHTADIQRCSKDHIEQARAVSA